MALYETVFISRQDISEAQVKALTEHFIALVKEMNGTVEKTEYWGLRTLAYPINKNRKGHYVLMNIDSDSATLNEVERQMKLNEDILRTLNLRVEAFEAKPSAGMRQVERPRYDRVERPRYDRGDRPRFDRSDRSNRSERSDHSEKPAR